ncbi:MAG: EFR1 family ferrodoxin [Anaerolineaceae bacterium]|nr:EFR1 family ferrodoxin [Anaerolineaceae bacterium]
MSMEIYYFSGTGNSLQVAREIHQRFPDSSLVPIMGLLNSEKIESNADAIGLVFPIHAFTFPWPVKRFLEKVNFGKASYIFAIATRECFATVFSDIDKLLKRQNKRLDAFFSFEMPETYIPFFNVYPQEKCAQVETEMLKQLAVIENTVVNKDIYRPRDHPGWFPLSHVIYPLITLWFQKIRFPDMEQSFFADHNCIGCGTCESVCLTNKIRMENQRPIWRDEIKCAYCFACLHYCPSQAIQLAGRNTIEKGRYHHPAIKVNDIIEQKST